MLDDVTQYAKAHPYQVGVLALLAGTALYLVMAGGQAEPTAQTVNAPGQSESLQMAAMQMGNQLQLAQVQAGAAGRVIEGQVEIESMRLSAQTFLGRLALEAQTLIQGFARDVSLRQLDSQQSVAIHNINAQERMTTEAIRAGTTNTEIQANTGIRLSEIAAGSLEAITNLLTRERTTTTVVPMTEAQSAQTYLAENPDVAYIYNTAHDEWANPNSEFYNLALAGFTPQQFAQYHYTQHGSVEGRAWRTTQQITQTT